MATTKQDRFQAAPRESPPGANVLPRVSYNSPPRMNPGPSCGAGGWREARVDELDPTARLWAARSAFTTFARSARSSAIATSNALSDVRRLNASMQSPPVNLGVDLRISNLASSIMCLRTADISGSSLIFSGMPAGWLGKGRATPSRCEYRVRTTTVFPREQVLGHLAAVRRVGRRKIARSILQPRWRQNPNHWRGITRLGAGVQVAHRPRRAPPAKPKSSLKIMNRDDVLIWVSLVSFVALCGAAIWVLFWL